MHIVIMGCGRVGSMLARGLEKRGHSVAVIDVNADSFQRLGFDFQGITVSGVGFWKLPTSVMPMVSRPFPVVTTRTSLQPGWFVNSMGWTMWWPASTTKAGPPSMKGWASPPLPPFAGPWVK